MPEITLPTCENEGHFLKEGEIDEYCDYCGKLHEFSLPASHNLKTVEVKAATCTEEGYIKKQCTECDYAKTEVSDKTSHNYIMSLNETTGTFSVVCTTCGKEYMKTTNEINTEETTTEEQPTTTKNNTTTTQITTTKTSITTQPTKETTTKAQLTTRQPQTTTNNPTTTALKLGKVKINSATKKKTEKKVKLTFRRVNKAKKYEVQISSSRRFKKPIEKKTTTRVNVTLTNSKFKNKKPTYVRVRAVSGKVYGKWSTIKKVKVK